MLVRRPEQAATFAMIDDVFVGQVTDPASLHGLCDGIDTVFSAVGITRQRDRVRYLDVDYRGNLALLREAETAGTRRFLYVSVLHGRELRETVRLVAAKERFVDALQASPVASIVVRPTGYFSDLEAFLAMASRGTGYLIGDGTHAMNPISAADLAIACISAALSTDTDVEVGGPDLLTHDQIVRAAFAACGSTTRVVHFPGRLAMAVCRLLVRATPERIYGPLQFFLAVMTTDMIAPPTGSKHLIDHFQELSDNRRWRSPNTKHKNR